MALARKHELDLAEREGALIPAELVKQRWAAIAVRVRDTMLAIPDKLAPLVAACQTAIEAREVLAGEVAQMLRLLAGDLAGQVSGNGASPSAALDSDGGPGDVDQAAPATHSSTSDEAAKSVVKPAKRGKRKRKAD